MNPNTDIVIAGISGAAFVAALVAMARAWFLPEGWSVRASYIAGFLVSLLYFLIPPGHPEITAAWIAQVIVTGLGLAWAGSGIASHLANSVKVQEVRVAAKAARKAAKKPTPAKDLPPPVIAVTPQGTYTIQPGQDTQPMKAYPTPVEWDAPATGPLPPGHREAK